MKSIKHLELHLAHSCNLTCESCSHYSNQGHKGLVSLDEADHWMSLWNDRISPKTLSLLGGEPTIHPDLSEFIKLARRKWPSTALRLVTNGFFLHRHPELPQVLSDDPKAQLFLSIHHAAPDYQERLEPILKLLTGWIDQYGIDVAYYDSHTNWTRRYHGFGSSMEPFADDQPRRSWENCRARFCPQLFEGKIWKCGPLAYLRMQDAKYQLSANWNPYLSYAPLEPDCSDVALEEFFSRKEESYCGMCPANPQQFEKPMPLPHGRTESATRGG